MAFDGVEYRKRTSCPRGDKDWGGWLFCLGYEVMSWSGCWLAGCLLGGYRMDACVICLCNAGLESCQLTLQLQLVLDLSMSIARIAPL